MNEDSLPDPGSGNIFCIYRHLQKGVPYMVPFQGVNSPFLRVYLASLWRCRPERHLQRQGVAVNSSETREMWIRGSCFWILRIECNSSIYAPFKLRIGIFNWKHWDLTLLGLFEACLLLFTTIWQKRFFIFSKHLHSKSWLGTNQKTQQTKAVAVGPAGLQGPKQDGPKSWPSS